MRYLLIAAVLCGCTTPVVVQVDGGAGDASGPTVCGLPRTLAISSSDAWSDCVGNVGASLVIAPDGSVTTAVSGATGVSAVATSCTSSRPVANADGSCTWALSVHCTSDAGDIIDINGSVSGSDPWMASPLTVEFTTGDESCSGTAESAHLRASGT